MSRYWQAFVEKFNGISKRERIIALLAALAVIYLLWSLLLLNPASSRLEGLQSREQALQGQERDLRAQEQAFSQVAGQNPDSAKLRQAEQLRQRLNALDDELQALAVGLVPADMLPQVLHDVLSSTGELELLGMQTLPVERLSLTGDKPVSDADQTQDSSPQEVDVFRHAVELKVRGSYFAVARYVEALEQLQWRFYWDKLNYEVERYPLATATLEVYTLSAGEGPLGE